MSDIVAGEQAVADAQREPTVNGFASDADQLVRTESPNVLCSKLPHHWRANKSIPVLFKVIVLSAVMDNTLVSLTASNQDVIRAELRNCVTLIKNQVCHDC